MCPVGFEHVLVWCHTKVSALQSWSDGWGIYILTGNFKLTYWTSILLLWICRNSNQLKEKFKLMHQWNSLKKYREASKKFHNQKTRIYKGSRSFFLIKEHAIILKKLKFNVYYSENQIFQKKGKDRLIWFKQWNYRMRRDNRISIDYYLLQAQGYITW